jgi:glycosyltransferase involved in cell wall biosynthesis
VLQVLGPSTGGIRRHVAALTTELRRRGRPTEIAGPPGVMDGLLTLDHIVPIPDRVRPVAALRSVLRLRGAVGQATLLHAHGLKAGAVALGGRRGRPVVVTVHNVILDDVAGPAAGWQRRLEQRVVARADRVIAVSEEISSRFARTDIEVIPPVAPEPEVGRDRQAVRRSLGVSDDDPLVICVARLHPQKDLRTLIAAVPSIRARHPRVQVRIVGEGPERERLEGAIRAAGLSGCVALSGSSHNAADEMAAADVVVLSSLWEGNPVVIGEAMRLARPVVATAVGAVPTLVTDGQTGRLVPAREPDRLGHAVADLLADPEAAARMAQQGQRDVTGRLGTSVLVDAVERVYAEITP